MASVPNRRIRRIASAAGLVLLIGGAVAVVGPAAPWVVDNLADGQRVWRLGRISIEGVSGGWLGDLRAETVRIADESGVWVEGHDVSLDWRPFDLFGGGVRLDGAHIGSVSILRQPALSEPRPSGNARFHIRIGGLSVDRIDIAEPVLGEAAQFSANFSFDLHRRDLRLVDLRLHRLDSDADQARVLYRPDGAYALEADIVSAPGGVLARLIGVERLGFRAEAAGQGDAQTGEAHYSAFVGDDEMLSGRAGWSPTNWTADGQVRLDLLPDLETIARRLGPSVNVTASGARVGAFQAHAETPFLAADLSGAFDADHDLAGAARLVATSRRVSDIARESPLPLGAARLEGELRRARGTLAFRGVLDAQEIDVLGRRARMAGPVQLALTDDSFSLTADLRAPGDGPALFANARLVTALSYDRHRRRFALDRAQLDGDAIVADGRGWAVDDNGEADGEFSGEWRLRRLTDFAADLNGAASGRWRASAAPEGEARVWTVTVDGVGAGLGGAPEILPQALGAAPRLDAMLRIEHGGLTVSHARISGARLRAGATGRIVGGEASLALEASARGPLHIGGAEIAGVIDATGRLTGRLARPTLTADAAMSSFSAGGAVVDQPQLHFTLAPGGRGYAGRVEAQGSISGQALSAVSNLAIADNLIALSELDAQLGGLAAQGHASIAARGISAELDINGLLDGLAPGLTGRLAGDVSLTPQTLRLDAEIADARAGELRVRAATLHAAGPYQAIAASFDMRGHLRQAPLTFTGAAALNLDESSLSIDGRGALAGADIYTRAPMVARWGDGEIEAGLNVAMADGVVQAQWRERRRALSGSVQIDDAPLAPLAAIWGERATGRIDGRVTLANAGGGLSGDADLTLTQARLAGRQRGRLDMRIVGALQPSRLTATIDARSTDGLVAHFEADAPVVTDDAPIRIALAPERRGQASWSVRGPAESLWAAARLQDQSLQGQLDGEGTLQFGAGYLSGAGHIELVDGRFEDKLTGVTLAHLNARVAIGDNGVTIDRFTAAGPGGGSLTAAGGSANQRDGRIVVSVNDMRVADRPEARAVASGELTLAWEGLHSSFSGNLDIAEASIDIAANAEAGIPTLDVIEINRPGDDGDIEEPVPIRRNGSTTLDVRIRAPGRVFTRGRGVDAEWSLDLRLRGTAQTPLVFGEARAVRGTLALSGQPFSIEDAVIAFNGDPMDANIDLTAVRDTADLTARIRLTGTAQRPEISFSSDPPLPEDEILPQVLFGRSVEDLSAFEAAQLAASLAALSGRTSLDLVDAARAAAGLDRFAVRQDEDGGFLVAGGVYLTRDVYVEVARTGLGQAQTRVEWTVRPRLVLITSFLGNGDQRVSLRWRRETD